MAKQNNVLILGYGEMGHAMEHLLADKARLSIWDAFPPTGPPAGFESVDIETAAPMADIVLFCLPVNPHREIIERIRPLLKQDCVCLSIAKGLDEAGQTAAQIFADVLGDAQPYALLYGPMISEEIRAGRHAFAQLACSDADYFGGIHQLFADTRLHIEQSHDVTGISWSVILKNVYAMVFGMADEFQLGDNVRGYLAVASLHELDQIVLEMGGDAGSPFHLAGLGDLITTATSEDSHHHELGRMLARGETEHIEGEGVHTLSMVSKHQLLDETRYPLFSLIHAIVRKPANARQQVDAYLRY